MVFNKNYRRGREKKDKEREEKCGEEREKEK